MAQGDREGAISAYEKAVAILQEHLRLDVASSNFNHRLAFRQETQEPVYKELIDLLLQEEVPSQKNLQRVREVSSSLLEAELTSFLQEPCDVNTPEQIDTVINQKAADAAVIYPVVLPDRLEVIVKLPDEDQILLHYRHKFTDINQDQFLENIKNLKLALEEDYTFEAVKEHSKRLYDLIVKPAEGELAANHIKTLVFTLDSQLQTIPMASLYDGKQYLIEKYAIAEFLGLGLADVSEPLQSQNLRIMAAGLSSVPPSLPSRIRNRFMPLEKVIDELDKIDDLDGIRVITLKDENFTLTNFNARLNEDRFPVVHLATHGQFSANSQETFLLTHYSTTNASTASQDKTYISTAAQEMADPLVEVNELAALFRVRGVIRPDPINLLVLNACETATGDDLAILGFAGTAIRAGARSAIASLWTLDDTPSPIFSEKLYGYLLEGRSKAEALQQVQLDLMNDPRYQHPRYWAPYILAGNWLPLTTSNSTEGNS